MTQWEYMTERLGADPRTSLCEQLNAMGKDGWELASLSQAGLAVLKRPLPPDYRFLNQPDLGERLDE